MVCVHDEATHNHTFFKEAGVWSGPSFLSSEGTMSFEVSASASPSPAWSWTLQLQGAIAALNWQAGEQASVSIFVEYQLKCQDVKGFTTVQTALGQYKHRKKKTIRFSQSSFFFFSLVTI